jgi:hypothetical protein
MYTLLDLSSDTGNDEAVKGNDTVATAQNAVTAAPKKSPMMLQKRRKTTTMNAVTSTMQ